MSACPAARHISDITHTAPIALGNVLSQHLKTLGSPMEAMSRYARNIYATHRALTYTAHAVMLHRREEKRNAQQRIELIWRVSDHPLSVQGIQNLSGCQPRKLARAPHNLAML